MLSNLRNPYIIVITVILILNLKITSLVITHPNRFLVLNKRNINQNAYNTKFTNQYHVANCIINENKELEPSNKSIYDTYDEHLFIPLYVSIYLIIPTLSITFKYFLDHVIDFTITAYERQNYIIGLLLLKRIYLYAIATITLLIASNKGVNDSLSLGNRLRDINNEMFGDIIPQNNLDIDLNSNDSIQDDDSTKLISSSITTSTTSLSKENINNDRDEIYRSMNEISDTTLAITLPIYLAIALIISSLIISPSLLGVGNTENPLTKASISWNNFPIEFIQNGLKYFSFLSNFLVSTLFVRIESKTILQFIQNKINHIFPAKNVINIPLMNEEGDTIVKYLSVFLSILIVFIVNINISPILYDTFLTKIQWPIQNIVNVCIGISVSRAVQLSRLPIILLALFGLVIYDYVAVIGIQQFTDGGTSIMEAVATAKFSNTNSISTDIIQSIDNQQNIINDVKIITNFIQESFLNINSWFTIFFTPNLNNPGSYLPHWTPGLFVVELNGKVTDALGLGDVVFPSILATWALRYDQYRKQKNDNDASNHLDNQINLSIDNDNTLGNIPPIVSVKNRSLFQATVIGFLIGCGICEIMQTGQGQPALIYLVPSMTISILLTATVFDRNNSFQDIWQYQPVDKNKSLK